MNMRIIVLVLAALLPAFVLPLHSQTRAGTDYAVAADAIDFGGGWTASSDYSANGSAGEINGAASGPSQGAIVKSGFVGQLYDLAPGIMLSAAGATLNERGTCQLVAARLLDDGTGLALNSTTVAWSILGGPLTSIDANGLVTAGPVYQDSPASVQAIAGGFTATLNLTVLDINHDDFGAYANDGLPDSWQVQYFGVNNPNAAPNHISDGSGLTNSFKFIAGLVPNNANSTFTLSLGTALGQPGKRNIVFNPSLTDRLYTIEVSVDLVHWSILSGPVPGNGSTQSVIDNNASGPQRFYRVQITKP